MAARHVAHRAAALAWLTPSAPRLAALADSPSAHLAADPASVLLLLRFARPTPTMESIALTDESFQASAILEAAATYLEANVEGWADPTQPERARILNFSKLIAEKAESLAAVSGTCSPAAARAAGLLAPLGWLAVATLEPEIAEACREHEDFERNPAAIEETLWGLSADAIARRLVHRWRLPGWLANTLTTLRLPVNDAVKLGADAVLAKVLRFAIAAAEAHGFSLGLLGHRTGCESREAILPEIGEEPPRLGLTVATDPRSVPLLPALLRSATQARRAAGQNRSANLEEQIDTLQAALQQARDEFGGKLRDAKLQALAELAAGAGHEINNPLAVISGNAQLLRAGEEDPDRRRSLETIVRQTGRIAELLQDLMQFARPAAAKPASFSVADLIAAVEREASPIATLKGVALRIGVNDSARFHADAAQAKKALGNIVRNAIEVTPTGGVVRVFYRVRHDVLEFIVEDNGPGPAAETVPHLFDPFFSGRSAGRGRGLGLSTAWQYARQNGGDLRFERLPQGLTRFVMTLPLAETAALPERQSA